MAEVQAELLLSVDQALAEIEALADLISEATTGVNVEVGVEVDTAQAEAEISGIEAPAVEVPIEADVAPAEAEIAGLEPEPVEVQVTADTAQAQQDVSGLEASFVGAGNSVDAFGFSLGAASKSAGALVSVGLGAFAIDSVGAFAEADQVADILDATLRNVGASVGTTTDEVQSLATQIQGYSGISDEAVQTAASFVAGLDAVKNAAGEGNDVFDRTIELSADLAFRMGGIDSASRSLAKALADPERGLSRLERTLGPFDAAVRENILSLAEQGDTMGAQKAILDDLESRYGTLAEAAGDSLAGQLSVAGEAFGEFQESVGELAIRLLPLLTVALEAIGPLFGAFGDGLGVISDVLGLIPGPIGAIILGLASLQVALVTIGPYFATALANPVIAAAAAIGVLVAAIGTADDAALAGSEAFANMDQAVASFGRTLAESGEGALAEQVLTRLTEIAPEFVTALTEAGGSVLEFNEAALQGPDALEAYSDSLGLNVDLTDEQTLAMIALTEQLFGAQDAADQFTAAEEANAAALGLTTEEAAAAQEALQALADSALQNLPTLSQAIGNVEENLGTFGQSITADTDPRLVIDNLRQMVEAFANFTENIAAVGEVSPLVAEALAPLGPEIAGAFAAALAEAPDQVTRNLQLVLQEAQLAGLDLTEVLTGSAQDGVRGATGALAGLAPAAGSAVEGAVGEVNRNRGAANDAGRGVGRGFTEGTGRGAEGMTPAARGAVNSATAAVAASTGVALAGGVQVGLALTAGMASGIATGSSAVQAAARGAVQAAITAANQAAEVGSPSKLFERLGVQMAEGMAVGLAESASVVAAAEALTRSAAMGASSVSAGGGSTFGDTNLNIYVPPGADAQGVANAVEPVLADHRRKMSILLAQPK